MTGNLEKLYLKDVELRAKYLADHPNVNDEGSTNKYNLEFPVDLSDIDQIFDQIEKKESLSQA